MTSRQYGYTLIEVLLASFIFMSVVTIAIGSFTSQLTLQSSSEAQRNVQQTAQAIIDAISRDIRTIEEYTFEGSATCTGGFTNCGSRLVFRTSTGERKEYRYFPGSVTTGGEIRLCAVECPQQNTLNNPTNVRVTNFYVEGLVPNMANPTLQLTQPFIVIHLTLETPRTGRAEEEAELEIQTMVTSRLFDKYR